MIIHNHYLYAVYLYDRCKLLHKAKNVTEAFIVENPTGVYEIKVISVSSDKHQFEIRLMVAISGMPGFSVRLTRSLDKSFIISPDPLEIVALYVQNYIPSELASFFDPLLSPGELAECRGRYVEPLPMHLPKG